MIPTCTCFLLLSRQAVDVKCSELLYDSYLLLQSFSLSYCCIVICKHTFWFFACPFKSSSVRTGQNSCLVVHYSISMKRCNTSYFLHCWDMHVLRSITSVFSEECGNCLKSNNSRQWRVVSSVFSQTVRGFVRKHMHTISTISVDRPHLTTVYSWERQAYPEPDRAAYMTKV